jgi:hypothetical protein
MNIETDRQDFCHGTEGQTDRISLIEHKDKHTGYSSLNIETDRQDFHH